MWWGGLSNRFGELRMVFRFVTKGTTKFFLSLITYLTLTRFSTTNRGVLTNTSSYSKGMSTTSPYVPYLSTRLRSRYRYMISRSGLLPRRWLKVFVRQWARFTSLQALLMKTGAISSESGSPWTSLYLSVEVDL